MRKLIKCTTIVTPQEVILGDLLIQDGKIAGIAPDIDVPADQVIDGEGKITLPGGIDAHTHFHLKVGENVTSDDFTTGTIAAAFGGNTMIIDHMGFGPQGCPLHHQAKVYHGYADGRCVIDYGFHGVVQHVDDEIIGEMASMVDDGHPSFKIYLTYDYKTEDSAAIRVLDRLKDLGGITTVHCENDAAIAWLRKQFVAEGKTAPIYHALSRPESCENEAVHRMIALAEAAGNAPLYIVHVSSAESARLIKAAKARGMNVCGETCPQYLFLDESRYEAGGDEGLKYIMSPPLRHKDNQEKLWGYIKDGTLSVVATDHCTFDYHGLKQLGREDFTKCPNGAPGVETRIPLMFSEGVSAGRLNLMEFANIISTNPAKLFGVYPQKGALLVGSDADIVMIDPHQRVTIGKGLLHEHVDYTPYEGMEVMGWPVMTMVRGEIVVDHGKLVQQPGFGRFVRRGHCQII